ncbi:hypothetical protein [Rhizobium leguminosarum]
MLYLFVFTQFPAKRFTLCLAKPLRTFAGIALGWLRSSARSSAAFGPKRTSVNKSPTKIARRIGGIRHRH